MRLVRERASHAFDPQVAECLQNACRKIGVSTRAAATLFAMEHGLLAWGELPMERFGERS